MTAIIRPGLIKIFQKIRWNMKKGTNKVRLNMNPKVIAPVILN
jgi:hypothetical protein